MKITRNVSIVLFISLILALCGCNRSVPDNGEIFPSDASTQNIVSDTKTLSEKYELVECGNFTDGHAVARFTGKETGKTILAVIDKNGKAVLSNINGFLDSSGENYIPCDDIFEYAANRNIAYSNGYLLIPAKSESGDFAFCLINSKGEVVNKFNSDDFDRGDYSIEIWFLGNGCWKLRGSRGNGLTDGGDSDSIYICSATEGAYLYDLDNPDISDYSCHHIGGGYVLLNKTLANFDTNEEVCELYNYKSEKIESKELNQFFLKDSVDKDSVHPEYLGNDVIKFEYYDDDGSHQVYYNADTNKVWHAFNDSKLHGRLISECYNDDGEIIFNALRYAEDPSEDEDVLIAYACDVDGNGRVIGTLKDFDGEIYCNNDTRYLNGSKGAITYDNEKFYYGYFDFTNSKFYPLNKSYPEKKAEVVAINASLIGIEMTGSDGAKYCALVDLECNEVVPPQNGSEIKQIGPWLRMNSDYYDQNGDLVSSEISTYNIIGYSDGLFNCSTNWMNENGDLLLKSTTVDQEYFLD